MAEVKNSFLSSKMNKDLDDRLIPNSEYRDALNIEVGKSETNNIGVLQNVYGNIKITPEDNPDLECIGIFMDNQNNRIFQFLTDYTDPDPNNITYPSEGKVMKITMYNFNDTISYVTLVEGLFLNFAKNKQFTITGVNLIEGLLFWTDNRNQPRKINIANALNNPNYYTTEEQISVAKYAPVDPITLYRKITATVADASLNPIIVLDGEVAIVPGMTVISENITGADYIIVTAASVDTIALTTTITLYEAPIAPITDGEELTFLISTMSNKADIPSWPGDPSFLEDKYVRFSYRFKYDDNEYSLMAPFTQIAYIPKQKGYFIDGNETDAYRSTVINWFENNVNNIELIVPLPDKVGNLITSYKILEIDILYKESDSTAIKVFETIPIPNINTPTNTNNNYYVQPYQSQKPYKTLSEAQTVRVYDKVPVRAKAQEIAGNRVIYGNYYDKYTCLTSINYNMSVQPKSPTGTNFIEYPNHTLKKNRNYQIGFVLADKFGRQSPVILSTVDLFSTSIGGGEYAKGSTVYSSYENNILFNDVRSWFGDALILYLNAPIDQTKNIPNGTPGLYAIQTSNSGFAITASTITDTTYTYTLDITAASNTPPVKGDIMRGFYTDYVEVLTDPVLVGTNQYTITTSGRVGDIYIYVPQLEGVLDIKFSYIYNPIGWYSYKIVVKQQEQDYYNVYLPGMLNGYPKNQTSGSQVVYSGSGATATSTLQNGINITQFPVSETGNTSHIVLINDNINKVPRDLSEVGPDQKQYRSSVNLYGRVENTNTSINIIGTIPDYSARVITVEYDTTEVGQGDWTLIKPGNGIQCVEANAPVPNTTPGSTGGTMPNPYRWLADTVVVSNVVTGTVGIITISAPNWILKAAQDPNGDNYINFIITQAENKQYFPTRKADTVIAIAAASEFNFNSNSEDNLSGTAGLNFYQLQNKPLIGRVSTVKSIGVVADDMIPFLSVYETRPDQSLLELFWETATTGLISDLNADVLTGFEGPASFGNAEYTQFEHQDPNGLGTVAGASNSKYVTDEFFVLDQNGFLLINTAVTLLSVTDGTGNSRLTDFGIETITGGVAALYRLYIKNPFVFNNNAGVLETYVFQFSVVDLDNPLLVVNLSINGRLWNNNPIITTEVVNYNITQNTTSIVTLAANNGSFSLAETGLKWTIVSGDTTIPSFNIDPYTGALSLINDQVPLGIYNLTIKVQDAVNTTNGQILLPENTNTGTKFDNIELVINVGDEPVPYWLRPIYQSVPFISPGSTCDPSITAPYGMAYIGPRIDLSGSYLPIIPGSSGIYQFSTNIEIQNAEYNSVFDIIPEGLTQGQYRAKILTEIPGPFLCDPEMPLAKIISNFEIYLYKRAYNPAITGVWELTNTENHETTPYQLGDLVVSSTSSTTGQTQMILTTFTINSDPDVLYEYAIGLKMNTDLTNTSGNFPKLYLFGEDANFTYADFNFNLPIQSYYTYYTGVETVTGYPSGIPYDTQDARVGIIYDSILNPIASGEIISGNPIVTLILSTVNNQVTPGLFARISVGGTVVGLGQVVNVNISNPAEITIDLSATYPSISLIGGNLQLYTVSFNVGAVYSNTIEGTEVKQLYTDTAFTQKWIPPFADKFYVFKTTKNYNPEEARFGISGPLKYTEYPFYSAKFNSEGNVIDQIAPAPNVQTAWVGQNNANTAVLSIANYSYNVAYANDVIPI